MSKLSWHATASLLEDVDWPFYVVVTYGHGYQYFSGILRTFDKYGLLFEFMINGLTYDRKYFII
ncbi:hypothetical protein ENU1_014470 [Entamoeba nuttalli P19]|uniref:Uncharacterized protein n=1 Tax=Entamoeba nuttalli (strain P19) TaxID=1076696 RepID=K2HI70_ENTNP|nr:hypothetical protein ENU1_014470 [Entamoeba nuttalli P19]EKE42654.1 hypothetical protein ENU1_014470 [Entamoeba nuttalli P19]|eukprot:XP_008855009.1 hypothetical protein ENU1_014470 [Entamoeba nuttalli P19]